jgi:tRNA threonylcarbamoyladenosine biosynthesis protein TsaB
MLLLAIDTSTRRVGVALGSQLGVVASIELGGAASDGPPKHAEQLVPAIDHLVRTTELPLRQLSAITVAIGPGMFTGLRVGVTTAKVIAQALRIPVIPVPSLDLVAYPLRHASGRVVIPALDARRNELYYARYRPVPGGLQRDSAYELASPRDLLMEVDAAGESVVVAGDGAVRFREEFELNELCEVAGPGFAAPSLSALVELAASRFEREDFSSAADVVPMYLRRSDAEIAHDRRPA